MFGIAALLSLLSQVSGTPYIPGGDSPAGTDCSGLASWVANVASGRPAFGSRFNTGNMESALLARGFHYGSAPDSVVVGWNGGHAAVTLPDGTPVSSGEGNHGVRVGGGGAYQPQFSQHMYLPMPAQQMNETAPPAGAVPTADVPPADAVPAEPGMVELAAAPVPPAEAAPGPVEAPAPAGVPAPEQAPAPEEAPAPVEAPPSLIADAPPADPAMPPPA
ncbi:MAG: peptidoglycan endopeptidase [Mycobacteriaceae bacterium]